MRNTNRLTQAAPDMLAILQDLEGTFDDLIFPEELKEDFAAADGRKYSVTITAKQWRQINAAISKAGGQ